MLMALIYAKFDADLTDRLHLSQKPQTAKQSGLLLLRHHVRTG